MEPPTGEASDWEPELPELGQREAEPGTFLWRPASDIMSNLLSFSYAAPHAGAIATLISATQAAMIKETIAPDPTC